jgi:N-acetylmuramoyl-L-alanine amidase
MRRDALESARKITLAFMVVIALSIVFVAIRGVSSHADAGTATAPFPAVNLSSVISSPYRDGAQSLSLERPTQPRPTATPKGPRPIQVGIIAGHYLNDSGAICPDGLREVDVNLAVAERVTARLRRKGYAVDLLSEFDERLKGYQADVLISLHSDSCDIWGLSGFKVARSSTSGIPEVEDELVKCLKSNYAASTNLSFQENTITDDMRDYHAFREVAVHTPAAIIELGFMADDRNVLLYRQDRLAKGLVDGIQCFLDARCGP